MNKTQPEPSKSLKSNKGLQTQNKAIMTMCVVSARMQTGPGS